ncbi:MAG: hypothetical protein JXB19_07375 [Bacteroidales bacterium]|nr:hypothetical protein [Bacteroidales bacterium]
MKKTVFSTVVLLGGLFIAAVFTSAQYMKQNDPIVEQQQVQYTCPMHPEVIRNEPGKCPICGMDLVEVTNVRSGMMMNMSGDTVIMMHDHMMSDSTGHMHDAVTGDSTMTQQDHNIQ